MSDDPKARENSQVSASARSEIISALPISLAPRGLSRVQAAKYIGVGVHKFDDLVRDGRMPKPKRIDARTIWDRHQLDEAFAALEQEASSPDRHPWD